MKWRYLICNYNSPQDLLFNKFCTHFVVPDNQVESVYYSCYHCKLTNRNFKTLLGTDSEKMDSKKLIRNMTNYGFDGVLINFKSIPNIVVFLNAIAKLPAPYNNRWDIFLCFESAEDVMSCFHILKEKKLDGFISAIIVVFTEIKNLTDNQFDPKMLVVCENANKQEIKIVLENKLGGILTSVNNCVPYFYDMLSTLNTCENRIVYPTSSIISNWDTTLQEESKSVLKYYYSQDEIQDSIFQVSIDITFI